LIAIVWDKTTLVSVDFKDVEMNFILLCDNIILR
jgi:hypothetical protein